MIGAPNAAEIAPAAPRAHHHPQVAAAQLEDQAQPAGQPRADLGVARLQPHRGARAVGDQRLDRHHDAVSQGHAAAAQGVGLDGVDRRARRHGSAPKLHQPQHRPTDHGRGQHAHPVQMGRGAEPLVHRYPEQDHVQRLADQAHAGDERARARADHRRHQRQHHLGGADQAAKPGRGALRLHRQREPQGQRAQRAPQAVGLLGLPCGAHAARALRVAGASPSAPSSRSRIGAQSRRWMGDGPSRRRASTCSGA